MPILLGIDTGGTYTDAVLCDERSGRVVAAAKALTTRHDLAVGIRGAARSVLEGSGVDPASIALVSLSTTLATNALVEGQGGRVVLILMGFDEAAAARAGIVDALRGDPCIRIGGGHDAAGRACEAVDLPALDRAISGLEDAPAAFAVAGMFSVRNPEHEIAVRDRLRERTGLPVTCGHELSSRLDGPRRAMTCVLNARLVPIIHRLLEAAERSFDALGVSAPMMVVRGDGALIGAQIARLRPVETILSGPAASLVGASHLTGERDALVSDIGGTTTDYALLVDGRPRIDPDGATVGGFRTMVEAVAMRTIGLGGDSEVRWGSVGDRPAQWGPGGDRPAQLGSGGHGGDARPRSPLPSPGVDGVRQGVGGDRPVQRGPEGRGGDARPESPLPAPGVVGVRRGAKGRGGGGVTCQGLLIGPRRLVPLSLLATEHPDLVADTLGRQRASPRRGGDVGRFALRVDAAGRAAGDASRRESMLLDRLAAGPAPLDHLLESQTEAGALESLAGRGLVILSAVTPSDAAHVLGMQDTWDAAAARAGVALFAGQLDSRGVAIAPDAETMSRAIVDALVDRSAEALLDAACDHDGHAFADLGRYLLRAAAASGEHSLVDFSVRLDRPVIGLGAPAPVCYPAVAARLGAPVVVPEHAGVANAVGAVVGGIRIRAAGTIAAPGEGLYRVFAGAGPRDFPDLETATAHARSVLEARARKGAADAGAGEVDLSIEQRDKVAVVQRRETLVERTVVAVASGRPRFAAG